MSGSAIKNVSNVAGVGGASIAILLLSLFGLKMNLAEASICCATLSAITAIFAFLLWRQKGPLERVSDTTMLKLTFGGALGIGLLLAIDALIAHVNLIDRSQWPNLWRSGGFLGFGTTAVIGVLGPILWFATAVRFVVLRSVAQRNPEIRQGDQASNIE